MKMLAGCLMSLLSLLASGLSVGEAAATAAATPAEAAAAGGQGRHGKRGFVVRRRPPPGYNQQNILYPPVHFLANGQPLKIFINNKEYTGEEEFDTVHTIASKDDEIVLQEESTTATTTAASTTTTTSTTTLAANSPITWLSGHFPFNGLPSNIFYLPAPVRWLGSQLQTVMAQGGHIILG